MNLSLLSLVPLSALVSLTLPGSVQTQDSVGCFEPMQCIGGISVGIAILDTPKDCLDYCKYIPDCLYFTHYDESNTCFAYSSCPETNQNCSDCISGNISLYSSE